MDDIEHEEAIMTLDRPEKFDAVTTAMAKHSSQLIQDVSTHSQA